MKYLILVTIACMASCKAQKEGPSISETDSDIVLIAEDGFSGIMDYESLTIRDAKSLNKFYSRINRTRKPGLPVPVVDFSKEMVIAVCLGAQKGEMTPVLARSNESDDLLSLTLEVVSKSSEKIQDSAVISYPFFVYKMPHSSKKLDIKKKE